MTESTHDKIVAKIIKEIQELDIEFQGKISGDTDMTTDMKIDSMDVMELVFNLEEEFDASVPVNELSNVYKISELAKLVEKNMG